MMTSAQRVEERYGNWCVVVPMKNLIITKDLNKEIEVNRVTFINREKLPYVRKKYGFPIIISEYTHPANHILEDESVKTYALLRQDCIPKEDKQKCLARIRDEIDLLAFSRLLWSKRDHLRDFGMNQFTPQALQRVGFFSTEDASYHVKLEHTRSLVPFKLNKGWRNFHKQYFFFELLQIIKGTRKVKRKWQNAIYRAAQLVGHSFQVIDRAQAFLQNIIALEMLLTVRYDKQRDAFESRLDTMLNWPGFRKHFTPLSNYLGTGDSLSDKIHHLYSLRCDLVHDGDSSGITPQDLVATDALAFNILGNIVKNSHKWFSKEEFLKFFKRINYEEFLIDEGFLKSKKSAYEDYKLFWAENKYYDRDYKRI